MHAEVSWIVTYLNTVIAGFVEADAALGARRRSCIVVSLSKHMGERERERESVGRGDRIMNLLSPCCLLSWPVYKWWLQTRCLWNLLSSDSRCSADFFPHIDPVASHSFRHQKFDRMHEKCRNLMHAFFICPLMLLIHLHCFGVRFFSISWT